MIGCRLGLLATLLCAGCIRAGFSGDQGQVHHDTQDQGRDRPVAGERHADLPGAREVHTPEAGPAFRPGAIVPLYADPDLGTSWKELVAAKALHPSVPVIAVANISNGPGAKPSPPHLTGIASLAAIGVTVIGYVNTNYGLRGAAVVQSDIDRWKTFYGNLGLSGIFLDQQATKVGLESYYASLTAYAKGIGFTLVVGDPGTDPAPSYVGTVDTMLIYQGPGVPDLTSLEGWHLAHDRRNFGIVCYAVSPLDPSFVGEAKKRVGYVYVTDDGLPDPWDTLAPYFPALLAALEP